MILIRSNHVEYRYEVDYTDSKVEVARVFRDYPGKVRVYDLDGLREVVVMDVRIEEDL